MAQPMVCFDPGAVIVMAPPKAHVDLHVRLTAGFPPASTMGTPGTHATGCGVHGCGVSTPDAADVALATAGLDSEEHIPNGGTLAMPKLSWMTASGLPSTSTCAAGRTLRVAGAAPNVQARDAVEVTRGAGMSLTVRRPADPGTHRAGSPAAPLPARRCMA